MQVNGKLKCTIKLPVDCDKQVAIDTALAEEKVQHAIEGKQMVKQIVVPGKIVQSGCSLTKPIKKSGERQCRLDGCLPLLYGYSSRAESCRTADRRKGVWT